MLRPNIENFTADVEAHALAELAAGKRVLEVGSYRGFGAVLMAQAGATRVFAVDWHRGDPDLGARDTLCSWWTNVRRHGVEDQVVGLVGRSEVVLPMLRERSFELAFVDGYHGLDQVREDCRNVLPLMATGGVVAFHDYGPGNRGWGVTQVVDELQQSRGVKPLRVVGTLAVVQLS